MKLSRAYITPVILLISIVLALGFLEHYSKLLQYRKMADALSFGRFIRIKNLDANAQISFRPSYSINKKDSFLLEVKDYSAGTDSLGFIITDKNHTAPDLKIAFFGSSTAQCLYVDEDKRIPEATARKIEAASGLKVNVWNCAAGGTHSYHTLNTYTNLAIHLNVDYAFFYGNPNDVATLIHYGSYNNKNVDRGLFFTIDGYLKKNNVSIEGPMPYTTDLIKSALHLKPEVDDFGDARGMPLILDSAGIISPIEKVYRTLITACLVNGTKPVLITEKINFDRLSYNWLLKNMPYFTPTPKEYEQVIVLYAQYNQMLRRLAKENSLMLIDLEMASLGFDCYYDAVHFNSKGSFDAAAYIATDFLAKRSLP